MKMLAEYLESAIKFERLAAEEKNAALKVELEKQTMAYRKLARKAREEIQPYAAAKTGLRH